MRLLLDTHTAIWWVNESEKLSSQTKALLLNDMHVRYISIASMWEIAIKVSLGKLLTLNGDAKAFFEKLEEMPVFLHPIKRRHVEMVETLPFIHRDPFDRLLVAIAKVDGMTILTADENIHQYDVPSVW